MIISTDPNPPSCAAPGRIPPRHGWICLLLRVGGGWCIPLVPSSHYKCSVGWLDGGSVGVAVAVTKYISRILTQFRPCHHHLRHSLGGGRVTHILFRSQERAGLLVSSFLPWLLDGGGGCSSSYSSSSSRNTESFFAGI